MWDFAWMIIPAMVVLAGLSAGIPTWLYVRSAVRQGTAIANSHGFTYKFWDNRYLKQWLTAQGTTLGEGRNAFSTDIVQGSLGGRPFAGFRMQGTTVSVWGGARISSTQILVVRVGVSRIYPRACADFTDRVSQISGSDAAFSERLRAAIDSVLATNQAAGIAGATTNSMVAGSPRATTSALGQFCADGDTLWMAMAQPNTYANSLFNRMAGYAEAVEMMMWEAHLLIAIDSRLG